MKMSKNYKRLCLVLGLSTIVGTGAVTAATGTKNIQATYRNIAVTYNGATQTLANEPFTVDGTTYLPLRAISQILGAQVDWNGSTNTVAITKTQSSTDSTALQQQLATANYNLTVAQRELETVKAELATYKGTGSSTTGTDITTAQIQASEDFLNSTYADYFSDIPLEFDLKKSSSRFILTASYSKSSVNTAFDKRPERQINLFLEEVCAALAGRHQGMTIEGTIAYNSTDKYNFTYSKAGVYSGSAVIELDEDDIEDFILDDYNILSSSLIDTLTVKDASVTVSDSKETITASLSVKTPSDADKERWNARSSDKSLKNELATVAEAIQSEYNTDYDVIFYLVDEKSDSRVATWRNNDLTINSWS